MDITLVTSSYDKVVHGTENEKKTGCGINLLRPENVTRYHRTSMMTDLKEITCEKCKASLAKKMIKADKKEMTRLLKEEKQREKMGISDEGIVPLGNTTARITRDPDAKRKEEEARRKAAEEARKAAEEARKAAEEAAAQEAANNLYEQQNAAAEPEVPRNTIPGTGVAIDDSLAQFAINVPQKEEEAPAPAVEDDFLAQFAIQKPDAEPAQAQVQPEDDFSLLFPLPVRNPQCRRIYLLPMRSPMRWTALISVCRTDLPTVCPILLYRQGTRKTSCRCSQSIIPLPMIWYTVSPYTESLSTESRYMLSLPYLTAVSR